MSRDNRKVLPDRSSSNGFTLIEVIVVIAVIAILVSIATLSIRGMRPNLDSKQTATNMVNLLWEARSRAVGGNFQHKLDFDVPNRQYRMQRGSQAYNTPGTGWTTVSGYDWSAFSNEVTITSGANCDSTATVDVQFNANGTAKLETPAGNISTAPVRICLQGEGGSKTYRVMISSSGTVTLQ